MCIAASQKFAVLWMRCVRHRHSPEMRSAERNVRRPKSIATAGKPFAMPFRARACDRDEAENPEDADARESRFGAVHDAAQPDQVAHGFVISVRHPDRCQLSGPMKTRQHGGVTTIRLHPIARLLRNQRRRHHIAWMAQACELAMNARAAQSGLVTKRQRLARTPKTIAKLAEREMRSEIQTGGFGVKSDRC
jgi:hypothetical protein